MTLGVIIGIVAIGFLLMFFELFLPGGLVGLIGGFLILAGVILGFYFVGPLTGVLLLLFSTVGVVAFFIWWVKYFPDSKAGRRFNLVASVGKSAGYVSQDLSQSELMGKKGTAITNLRPSGTAEIEGRRVDVISDGGYLEKGREIIVVEVNSNRVVIRPADASAP